MNGATLEAVYVGAGDTVVDILLGYLSTQKGRTEYEKQASILVI